MEHLFPISRFRDQWPGYTQGLRSHRSSVIALSRCKYQALLEPCAGDQGASPSLSRSTVRQQSTILKGQSKGSYEDLDINLPYQPPLSLQKYGQLAVRSCAFTNTWSHTSVRNRQCISGHIILDEPFFFTKCRVLHFRDQRARHRWTSVPLLLDNARLMNDVAG